MCARVSLARSASIRLSRISLAQSIEYCSQAVGARVGGDGGGIGDEHGGDTTLSLGWCSCIDVAGGWRVFACRRTGASSEWAGGILRRRRDFHAI